MWQFERGDLHLFHSIPLRFGFCVKLSWKLFTYMCFVIFSGSQNTNIEYTNLLKKTLGENPFTIHDRQVQLRQYVGLYDGRGKISVVQLVWLFVASMRNQRFAHSIRESKIDIWSCPHLSQYMWYNQHIFCQIHIQYIPIHIKYSHYR